MGDGRDLDELPLRELTERASETLRKLIRQEIALVRVEMADDAKRAAKGGALAGAGLYVLAAGALLLFAAAGYGIGKGAGIGLVAGYVIMGFFFGVIAFLAAAGGAVMLRRSRGGLPRTKRTVSDSLAWLRHPTQLPNPELEQLRASHQPPATG